MQATVYTQLSPSLYRAHSLLLNPLGHLCAGEGSVDLSLLLVLPLVLPHHFLHPHPPPPPPPPPAGVGVPEEVVGGGSSEKMSTGSVWELYTERE